MQLSEFDCTVLNISKYVEGSKLEELKYTGNCQFGRPVDGFR